MSGTYNIGLKVIKKLVQEGDSLSWYKTKLREELFKGIEVDVFKWAEAHLQKYFDLPKLPTLEAQFPDVVEVDCPEPPAYYIDLLEKRYFHGLINAANIESQQILKDDKDAWAASQNVMEKALLKINEQKYSRKILNVGQDAPKLLIDAYHHHGYNDDAVIFGWPYLDDMCGGLQGGDVASFVGRPAAGKAQPLTSKVLTKEGFRLMGDLKVGDRLASIDGKDSRVIAIHPQGKKPVYRLSFQDGRFVEASDEHLWRVYYRGWASPRVETTLQLIARLKHKRYVGRLSIDLFDGSFGNTLNEPFSPYLLGVFLGDGCLRDSTPSLTTCDHHIAEKIASELRFSGLDLVRWVNSDCQYSASDIRCGSSHYQNRLVSWFMGLGLWGLKSEEKFIPEKYLEADNGTRRALLQGLMDTDGTAEINGGVSFSSSSEVLAQQVQYLSRSLGHKATLSFKSTNCLPHWRVHIVAQDRATLFSLPRKVERVKKPRTTHINHRLTLGSVEYIGQMECQCITVSHPSSLYVSDDFVVTHNSWLSLFSGLVNWRKGHNVLFVSMEMTALAVAQRLGSMFTEVPIKQVKMGNLPSMAMFSDKDGKPVAVNSKYKQFVDGLHKMKEAPGEFQIVDGNLAANVDDIYLIANRLKSSLVIVDGGYLVRNPNPKLDRFTRVAENVEAMKRHSTDLNIPTLASWQFNRTASSKGKGQLKGQKAGLDDIGYSDAIGQISSIVLGLFQDEGIETINKRRLDLLKGRNGEVGNFSINWLFDVMNFHEAQEEEGDLQNV